MATEPAVPPAAPTGRREGAHYVKEGGEFTIRRAHSARAQRHCSALEEGSVAAKVYPPKPRSAS